jgi:hypothetical protein
MKTILQNSMILKCLLYKIFHNNLLIKMIFKVVTILFTGENNLKINIKI